MKLDPDEIISQLDPEDRKLLHEQWAEVFREELPRMAVQEPETLRSLLGDLVKTMPQDQFNLLMQEIMESRREETETNSEKDQADSKPEAGTSPNEA